MTDTQLIREIKDGDVQRFAELVLRYERKIRVFIEHIIRHSPHALLAEDLTQETFIKAYLHLATFREGEASFSTWLYTIARNTAISELRKKNVADVSLDEELGDHFTPVAVDALPEKQALQRETISLVRQAIHRLPEKQRTALVLREYEGLDYQEIAQVLMTTVSSVKSLLFRARGTVKEQLGVYVVGPSSKQAEGSGG